MTVQPQKAYWATHTYQRHSVEREVLRFMGWQNLVKMIKVAEKSATSFADKLLFADALAIGFATAGRVSAWSRLKHENFVEHPDYFEVRDMLLFKRYKKLDHVIVCRRCGLENPKFEVVCKKCGANLVYGGRKKWKTMPLSMVRFPFKFPKDEATTPYILRRLSIAKSEGYPYLFYNPRTKKSITPTCFYDHFVEVGEKVGLDMWPHRERAERCKQLREEYEFTKDDLKRFTMIVADKTLDVYAGTSVPYEKKMGIL